MAVVESRDIFGRVSCAQGISEFWKEKSMQENRIDAFERKLDAGLVLSIVATGIMSFSGVCVETAMNVTFPTLMREFGVNTATVQWLTTAYLLVLAAVVPVSGFLNRRFKTKHVFCFAMAFYIAGIVCGMTAQVFPALLLGRVLEGIGTGVALPLMFNIITEQAPQERLGLMMGIGSLVTAVAPAVGPSVGGWLSETFGWRAIFAALLPLLLVAYVLGISSIRQSHKVSRESFDVPGWLCLAASFACLVLAVDEGANLGWTSPAIIVLFVAFVILLTLFVRRERSCDAPLINLGIFGRQGYVFGLGVAVSLQFTVLGFSFLLPSFAQLVLGVGQTEAGSILLWGCLVGAVLAPFSGQLLDRFGARLPIMLGVGLSLLATCLYAAMITRLATMQLALVYVVFAAGQGLMYGNNMTCALRFLPAEVKPDGNAMFTTLQQLSGAIGTSVIAAVVNAAQAGVADSAMAQATAAGAQSATLVLVCAMALSFVFALLETERARR